MALFDRVKSFFTGERPEEDEEDFGDDEELDEDDEDEVDDNPDGFGSDDDNPDGYGEEYVDPRSIDEDDEANEEKEDKKEKKKSKKEKTESEGTSSGGKRKAILDPTAMNALASRLKCGRRTKKVCPFCKQQSIYPEPMGTMMIRKTLYLIVGVDRKKRFVCLNKNCKAFYKEGSPRARFVESPDGKLHTSHGLNKAENPMSMRPSK